MRCPYLSSASRKVCIKMPEEVEEELTEADVSHFCNGDPVYCYYFRAPSQERRSCLPQSPAEEQDIQWETSVLAELLDSTSMRPNRPLPEARQPEREKL